MYKESEFDHFVELCNNYNQNQKHIRWGKFRKILKRTENNVIIEKLGMHDMSRVIHVFQKKYLRKPTLKNLNNDWEIRCGRAVIGRASYQSVTIHFIKIENHQLMIEGESSVPAFFGEKATQVYAIIDNTIIKTDNTGFIADKKLFGEVYELCRSFKLILPLSDIPVNIKFAFRIKNKQIMYRSVSAQRFSPVANVIPDQYASQKGYILQIKGDTLSITPECDRVLFENNFVRHISQEIAELRKEAFAFLKNKKQPIWVFVDRLNHADDNASCLFRYVNENKIPVDSYFIVSPSAPQYKELKEHGKTVVPFSKEHLFLYLICDAVISSQCNGVIENPFMNQCEEVRDLYHNHKTVFLQHGVIKDDMSITLNRFNTGIDVFITSAYNEWKSIIEGNYSYSKEQVWLTGLPRFDYLSSKNNNKILIMPTWRKELMENVWNEDINDYIWVPNNDFYKSKYYLKWNKVLNSNFLKYIHEKTGYEFIFVPHPLVKNYFKLNENDSVKMMHSISYNELYSNATMLITDYSSAVFDGVYLGKSVVYYQFDKNKFYKNHTYRKGFFDYHRDGFGPVCHTRLYLYLMILCQLYNIKFINKKYDKRIQTFLKYRDGNNCKRICEKLLDLE